MPRRALRRALPKGPGARAAALAAAVTVLALCLGDAAARSRPWGPNTRGVNDLGNQYVPFHAHLRDLLLGGDGGWIVNWRSGFGTSFLPDLGTYVSSPFALLVVVFPRDRIDLAVYVITLAKTAAAGAAMAWLLMALRPGRWWAAGALGASYALCGWSVADASYNPMWLDGLIALPLLCLAGEWALAGRRRVLGPVVVAVVWIANFYTAYMATLGAALVLLARLLLMDATVRRRLAALGRAAVTAGLGVGLAAPLVAVVYFGSEHASPGRDLTFHAAPWTDVFARLLPGTYSFLSPAVYLDSAALLLALALPLHAAVPRATRAVWTALPLAVLLSLQWGPTHLVWHAFATPNGSPFRQVFVLSGLMVIAAWLSLAHGVPGRRPLLAAGAVLGLVWLGASSSELVEPWAYPLALAGAAAAVAALLLTRRCERARRPRLAVAAAVLLVGAQIGQSSATAAVATASRLADKDDYAPWGERQRTQRQVIAEADGWPRYRTDPGREQTVGNDPLLVGGQGAQYYSSHTSEVLSRTLTALGGGWTSRGRSVQSLDNPVTDAVFSVGARVHSPPDPHQKWWPADGTTTHATRQDVPPLVTVRPAGPAPGFGPSAYRNQEKLLGAEVYTVPEVAARTGAGPGRPVRGEGLKLPARDRPNPVTLTASCPAGSRVFLWAPRYWGTAALAGGAEQGRFRADHTKIAAMEPIGTVPAGGRVEVALGQQPGKPGVIPEGAVGCLDPDRLRDAVDRLKRTGATKVEVEGRRVRAQLPPGTTGTAVVAAPRIAGWRCAAGDGPERPAANHLGLIAVPLDGTADSVSCTFHPPGLRLGTAVGAASLVGLAALGLLPPLAARRRAGRPAEPAPSSLTRKEPPC
ncbi:YfhO family protein [Streptomyces capparidis]